jgi:hypothetical protein
MAQQTHRTVLLLAASYEKFLPCTSGRALL